MIGGLWAMASGVLSRDPESRSGSKGPFAVATLRAGSGDAAQWISVLAFGDAADRLLGLRGGDGASVSGRLELRTWTDRNGADRTGLTLIASEVAAARPAPKARKAAA